LQLQRTVGNHATRQLLQAQPKAPASIQRQTDFGLATSQNVNSFVSQVQPFKDDPVNQTKSFEALALHACQVVNGELLKLGVPEVKYSTEAISAGSAAEFRYWHWKMIVNSAVYQGRSGPLKIGQLKQKQVSELVGSVYHEARHAEQHFKVGQYLAGKGKSETLIMLEAEIPSEIAKRAKAKPMAYITPEIESFAEFANEATGGKSGGSQGKSQIAAHNEEVKQIQAWHEEDDLNDLIYDRNGKIRDNLAVISAETARRRKGPWDVSKLEPAYNVLKNDIVPQFDREITRVSAQPNRTQMVTKLKELKSGFLDIFKYIAEQQASAKPDRNVLDLIQLNTELIDVRLNLAYVDLLTEEDAFTQGRKVGAALKPKAPAKTGTRGKTR
jgi:hypothetical protein